MTKEKLEELKAPFHPDDLQWRIGTAGCKADGKVWAMVLAYVDDRAIQDRLDKVCGAENWQIAYAGMNGDATTATISIKIDGEWVSKSNGAGATDIEAIKGGYSGASKRAASVWGIGRYLYNLKDNFANVSTSGKYKAWLKSTTKTNQAKKDINYKWNPPALPSWATPDGFRLEAPPQHTPKTEDDSEAHKEIYASYYTAIKTATTLAMVDEIVMTAEGCPTWNKWPENWQNNIAGIAKEIEDKINGGKF